MTENNRLENFIFSVLLLATALLPIFFVPVKFISIQFATSILFSGAVILSVCLFVINSLKKGSIVVPEKTKYFFFAIFIFPLVYVASGFATGISPLSFYGYTLDINSIGFISLSFVYLFLVFSFFTDKQKIFYAYFSFLVSSIFIAAYLLLRIFLGVKFLSFGVFNSITMTPILSWNNTGIFFGICLLLSLMTFELAPISRLMKFLSGGSILFSMFFLALVNFQIIWSIVGLCSFLFILYSMFDKEEYLPIPIKTRIKRVKIFPVVVLIASIFFSVWGSYVGTFLSTKLGVTNIEIRPSLSATYSIAKNTIERSPLLGAGPSNFINNWLLWKPQDLLRTIYWNLDFNNGIGLIPTYVVTTGILGLLAWIIFFVFYIKVGIKSILGWQQDKLLKYLTISSFFVSLYLWVMAIVYIPTEVIYILTFFFTGLFFAAAALSGTIKNKQVVLSLMPKTGFFSTLLLILVLTSSVIFGLGLYKSVRSLWFYQKSFDSLNTQKDSDSSEKLMLRAIDLVPYDVYYRALAEIELVKLNSIAAQRVSKESQSEVQKKFADTLTLAIRAGMSARDADPTNYQNWISLGSVYEAVSSPNLKIKGAYDGATASYKEALRINPRNPAILIMLSRLSATQSDLNNAKEYAIQAIQLKGNYLDAYFILSQIEVASGNVSGAIEATTASTIIDPTNPAVFFQLGLLKYNKSDWNGAIEAFEKATSLASDYANAKYFLGLSYEIMGQHDKAIKEFQDLKQSNPNSTEVNVILSNLLSGKPIFTNSDNKKPEKGKTLPVQESNG